MKYLDTYYAQVAASQTGAAVGAQGSRVVRVVIVPETTAAGAVTLIDGTTSLAIYTGGTVGADLTPIVVELNLVAHTGAWTATTGANVHIVVTGAI